MKDWSHERKQQARRDTIIAPYRQHFGRFPVDGQYWAMCGECDKPGCEFGQMVEAGLIAPHQFHGVERVWETHQKNLANTEGNWYHDDFYSAMERAKVWGQFNPALVNADFIRGPAAEADYLGNIMALLLGYDVMLVANFVLKAPRRKVRRDGSYAIEKLTECPAFRHSIRNGWEYSGEYYEYDGTGPRSKTVMGSFIFVQKRRLAIAA